MRVCTVIFTNPTFLPDADLSCWRIMNHGPSDFEPSDPDLVDPRKWKHDIV